ncbi:hypothetical protein [Microbacterium sp. TPD7012]|uniref:hypothetical protein n=1 Tax=unclassified Microbacterium TaxID=2609290 RepID=UPI000D515CD9|nr:hypothetical protein [Microbacterium sp. TPD7012]PVE92106.1 hypothetical protein DC434_17980 [Microbacterium sp. TPD7012]
MSNPIPPVVPFPDDDTPDGVPTKEVDGEQVPDTDIDDALVDSAEADRVASGAADDDEDDLP